MRKDLGKLLVDSRKNDYIDYNPRRVGGKIHPDKYESDDLSGGRKKANPGHYFWVDSRKLERILKCKVGQPWNKVYSELTSALKSSPNIMADVKKRLSWTVELAIEMINKVPYPKATSRGYYRRFEVDGLYVNPETGILCFNKRPKRQYKNQPITNLLIDNQEYELIDNLWYRIDKNITNKLEYLWDENLDEWTLRAYAKNTECGPYIRKGCIPGEVTTVKRIPKGYEIQRTTVRKTKQSVNKKELKMINDFISRNNG